MKKSQPVIDRTATIAAFYEAVNMAADELEKWLETEESKSVGQTRERAHESVGHQSGRTIVRLLRQKTDFGDADLSHMNKVVGYVHRHLAQRPGGDVEDTNWRYSLMNWGHDPMKSA